MRFVMLLLPFGVSFKSFDPLEQHYPGCWPKIVRRVDVKQHVEDVFVPVLAHTHGVEHSEVDILVAVAIKVLEDVL